MAEAVYLACAVFSAACATLLLRSWAQTRTRLILWTALCFVGLAANNVLLFVDLVLLGPALDLSVTRAATAFASLALLVAGLVWDGK